MTHIPHRTICNDCGKILTSGNRRLHCAVWDTSYPATKPMTDHVVYAYCEDCADRHEQNLQWNR